MSSSNAFRTWWKPWTWTMRAWVIAILFMVGLSPFITRWAFLWLIPDVALPFNPEELMLADLPDDQNALVVYRSVMKRLLDKPRTTPTSAAVSTKPKVEDRRAKAVEILTEPNPDPVALSEYLRAGEMQRAAGPSMKTVTFWTNLTLNQPRELARHYSKLGQMFEEGGDLETSWKCHRANLQLSIHVEQPGLLLQAMVGLPDSRDHHRPDDSLGVESIGHEGTASAGTRRDRRRVCAADATLQDHGSRIRPAGEYSERT